MFGTIRKHQTWLWAVIITATIISFVVYFSPTSNRNSGREVNYGSISGKPVSRQGYENAALEVQLRWLFMRGEWPNESARQAGYDEVRETYQWLFLVEKQKEMGIYVGVDAAANFANQMVRGFARDASVTPAMFVKQVLEPRRMTMADFERYVRHYLGIQELIALFGSSGKLITPQEAKEYYVRENQERSTEAYFFSGSNFLSRVTTTPDVIAQFYTNRLSYYRIPERITVQYVDFPISNFLAKVEADLMKTNLNQMVEMAQTQRGTNLFQGAKTIEESKAKLRQAMIREAASLEARRKANDFASPLFEPSAKADQLQAAATKVGLTVKTSAPFRRGEAPAGLQVGQDFTQAAFGRTPEEPFAGPIAGEDAWYVIAPGQTLPSEVPSLESIRQQVETEYKQFTAENLARDAAQAFRTNALKAIADGKPLPAPDAGIKAVPLQFSISTRSLPEIEGKISLDMIKQLAFSTDPGKLSEMQYTREGGVLVFVKAKVPLDEAKMNRDLAGFMESLRQARQSEQFNEWFRKEAERALRDTPISQQEAQKKGSA